jgi:hypothetical protein
MVGLRSDTCIPSPPVLQGAYLAQIVELVRNDDALKILHAFVAQLRFDSQAHRRARPLGNGGPTFFAGVFCDLRARGEPLQVGERICAGPSHAPFDRQAQIGKRVASQAWRRYE